MLIINADDFGLSSDVNAAVVRCFQERLCSSTTIMATMGGFEEACELAHANGFQRHVGIHFTLTDSFPLTEEIRRQSRFCGSRGELSFSPNRPVWSLANTEKRALAAEARAQIARCRQHGIPLTHLDSHHHVHNEWGVMNVLLKIVREESIPFVRLSRNVGQRKAATIRVYKSLFNNRLRAHGLARTRHFGSVTDVVSSPRPARPGTQLSCEVMVHPVVGPGGSIEDDVEQKDLSRLLAPLNEIIAVSYAGKRFDA